MSFSVQFLFSLGSWSVMIYSNLKKTYIHIYHQRSEISFPSHSFIHLPVTMKLPIISLLFLTLASTTLAIPTLANAKAIFARDQKQRSVTRRLGSDNWSGALVHYSDTGRYKSVYAELVIPKIIFPTNGRNKSATYSTSVWVGFGGYNFAIDGYASALDGILQTGFYYLFDPEGDAGVYAFYEVCRIFCHDSECRREGG